MAESGNGTDDKPTIADKRKNIAQRSGPEGASLPLLATLHSASLAAHPLERPDSWESTIGGSMQNECRPIEWGDGVEQALSGAPPTRSSAGVTSLGAAAEEAGPGGWKGVRARLWMSQFSGQRVEKRRDHRRASYSPSIYSPTGPSEPDEAEMSKNNNATPSRSGPSLNGPSCSTSATAASPASSLGAKGILTGTTVYINTSTYPLISDYALKKLLVRNGAQLAAVMSARVTHVIVGRPQQQQADKPGPAPSQARPFFQTCAQKSARTLAASKLAKIRIGSRQHHVTVDWVLSSVKEGRKLSEDRFRAI